MLKNLGKGFYYFTVKSENKSRPLTIEEEKALIDALSDAVDVSDIEIIILDDDADEPYIDEYDLRMDVIVNKRFRTKLLSCPGVMSRSTYTYYRAMHDILNHVLQNKSFSPFDEFLSFVDLYCRLNGKVSQYTLDVLFTDVACMNAVYAWSPSRWNKLERGKHHRVVCYETFQVSSLLRPSKH